MSLIAKGTFEALAPRGLNPAIHQVVEVPLVGPSYDALDVLEQLSQAHYRGTLRVLAPKLPNRQLVLRELEAVARRKGILIELVSPN
ncbi:hypothetical protein [Tabrizicola sp.]|uniref:hypothetical protein n=1 Tax=Tabrizicola sp. TaxID=2005166 RepID=UPI00286CCBAD|nr:hypothetical protein [Tabrizicola sp.]